MIESRRDKTVGLLPPAVSNVSNLEPVHNLSEILFIYSHILATVSLFSRPGQNCYIPLCYLSFQQVKKDPEQALRPCIALKISPYEPEPSTFPITVFTSGDNLS